MIVGISRDAPEANAAFAKKNKFPFVLLSDEDGKISMAYGAVMKQMPAFSRRNTYVIGPDGKVEQVLVDVDPGKSPKALLETLP